MTAPFVIHHGECLEVLRTLPDCSIDSIVTDPPYGLSDHKPAEVIACLTAWLAGEPYLPKGKGFMGKTWDAWVPGPEVFRECLRVLKPGGHMLAFAGTRSMDMMSMAIRLAGFELRDSIGYAHDDDGGAPLLAWCYGSGFPKNLDVSKAIDKMGGISVAWFGAWLKRWREDRGLSQKELCERCGFFGKVNRGTIANWELGLGQPSPERFNRICEVLSLPFDSIDAAEREVIAQGFRIRRESTVNLCGTSEGQFEITAPSTDAARQWEGWGTALKPAWEPIILARKPLQGTVSANILAHGTGALNINGCRVPGTPEPTRFDPSKHVHDGYRMTATGAECAERASPAGRWPANVCHDGSEEVLAGFPQADSARANGNPNNPKRGTNHEATSYGQGDGKLTHDYRDTGSAARFFYCAKASRADRNEGLEDPGPQFKHGATLRQVENTETKGNTHPTVKPTDLMRYLCRLITPPGGTVLDPFFGSGSTGKGAILEGFSVVGIERDADSVATAQARCEHAVATVLAAKIEAEDSTRQAVLL